MSEQAQVQVQTGFVGLDDIRVNPIALRDVNRKDESFKELVDSVRQRGVLNAISLRPKPGEDGKKYELVDGLQRFTAATEVGTGVLGQVGVIPATVMDRDDAQALIDQVIGNAQRIETKPAEYSKHLRRILGFNPTWTISELAVKLNKSPTWIDKQLSLNKLNEQIQKVVDEGKMPLVNAYALAQLPSEEQQEWLQRAMTMPTNEFAERAQARVKEIRDAARKGKSAEPEKFTPASFLRPKKELEQVLQISEDGKIPPVTQTAVDLVRSSNIAGEAKDKTEAAAMGFQLGLQFVLNLDSQSVAQQQKKWEADKKAREEQKIRRDAEKAEKKQKEAQDRAAQAEKDAAEARKRAAELPAQENVPV